MEYLKLIPSWITIFGIIFLYPLETSSHPQCLDFRPPWKADPPLRFCTQYSNFGCCTAEQDLEIWWKYYSILTSPGINRTEASYCVGYLYHILCLSCSPYAAHVYDAETDGTPAAFPGLCNQLCTGFFNLCRNFVPKLTDNTYLQSLSRSPSAGSLFCNQLKLSDNDYCFPNVYYNANFQKQISEAVDDSPTKDCICLEEFASGLRNPLIFRHFPDGTGRIAVGEQIGVLHVYSKNGEKLSTPFLDLKNDVLITLRAGDERGLLGLAFHPNFASNHKLYCYFSARINGRHVTQLVEYITYRNDTNRVDPKSERLVLQVDQPYSNHNGGELMFGLDGHLYLFLGDGGAGGDPQNYAQNKATLLGKAIRIDIDSDVRPYGIPPDNPFIHENGTKPEIYAYGIRNIWRCDVDEGDPETGNGRGRIFCGDVGQSAYEEIDIIYKGGNYGWNAREGYNCYRRDLCGKIGPEIYPIFTYPHSTGKSVTGGHVYRGCLNPALNGAYIFGDYTNGKLFKLTQATSGGWTGKQIRTCGPSVCFNGLKSSLERNILSFGEDEDGEIYILTTSWALNTSANGKIYKIIDPRRRGDPSKCRSRKRT